MTRVRATSREKEEVNSRSESVGEEIDWERQV